MLLKCIYRGRRRSRSPLGPIDKAAASLGPSTRLQPLVSPGGFWWVLVNSGGLNGRKRRRRFRVLRGEVSAEFCWFLLVPLGLQVCR